MVKSNHSIMITVLAKDLAVFLSSICWPTALVPGDLMPYFDHLGLLHKHGAPTYTQPHTHTHTHKNQFLCKELREGFSV